jgi:hypothetical protein
VLWLCPMHGSVTFANNVFTEIIWTIENCEQHLKKVKSRKGHHSRNDVQSTMLPSARPLVLTIIAIIITRIAASIVRR